MINLQLVFCGHDVEKPWQAFKHFSPMAGDPASPIIGCESVDGPFGGGIARIIMECDGPLPGKYIPFMNGGFSTHQVGNTKGNLFNRTSQVFWNDFESPDPYRPGMSSEKFDAAGEKWLFRSLRGGFDVRPILECVALAWGFEVEQDQNLDALECELEVKDWLKVDLAEKSLWRIHRKKASFDILGEALYVHLASAQVFKAKHITSHVFCKDVAPGLSMSKWIHRAKDGKPLRKRI